MVKKKTSLSIDENEWKEWVKYAVLKTGSTYKVSELSAEAFREYRKNHPLKE